MFSSSFHIELAKIRSEAGLSLRALSSLTGITHQRLSRLESGEGQPREEERRAICKAVPEVAYRLRYAPQVPERFFQRLRIAGNQLGPQSDFYFPPADRHSRQRFHAAQRRFPKHCNTLLNSINLRSDIKDLSNFCDLLSIGSAVECIFVLSLIAQGAVPAFRAPLSLSPQLPNPAICPTNRRTVGHKLFPCLTLKDEGWFPQVSFKTPRTYTVDFLKYSKSQGWSVIEIDGLGHQGEQDDIRTQALLLPVQRINQQQVLNMCFETQKAA